MNKTIFIRPTLIKMKWNKLNIYLLFKDSSELSLNSIQKKSYSLDIYKNDQLSKSTAL